MRFTLRDTGNNNMKPNPPIAPEWMDVKEVERVFGIKRSLQYHLMGEGLIKGISLRQKGTTRGKRLLNVKSIRDFLAKQETENK